MSASSGSLELQLSGRRGFNPWKLGYPITGSQNPEPTQPNQTKQKSIFINVPKFPTWLGSSGWFLTRIEDKVYTSVCIVSQGLLVAMSKILQRKMTSSLLQQLSKLLLFSKFTKGSSSNENNCGVQIRLTYKVFNFYFNTPTQ